MSSFPFFLSLTFFLCFFSLPREITSLPIIGATYSDPLQNPPSPEKVFKATNSLGLKSIRLEVPDPSIVKAFVFTNTTLILNIPNSLILPLAFNRSNAALWIFNHVLPFFPRAQITTISVGDDLLASSPNLASFLLPAMMNIHLALLDLGISKISVSTIFSFISIIPNPFPPSAAQFEDKILNSVVKSLLEFLQFNNSSFLINMYPYNVYQLNSGIPIGFALFEEHSFNFRDDLTTGVRCWNLFDMMIDAVVTAMAVEGYQNIPIVVTETGWPSSSGDVNEVDANLVYAELYLKGLVERLRSGTGTPLKKEGVAEAYIYELFDEEAKEDQGNHNWDLVYPNMTKYMIDFSGQDRMLGWGGGLLNKCSRKKIGMGTEKVGFYYLTISKKVGYFSVSNTASINPHLWHQRLGH